MQRDNFAVGLNAIDENVAELVGVKLSLGRGKDSVVLRRFNSRCMSFFKLQRPETKDLGALKPCHAPLAVEGIHVGLVWLDLFAHPNLDVVGSRVVGQALVASVLVYEVADIRIRERLCHVRR